MKRGKSQKNKENNYKILFIHSVGIKSFSRVRWEHRNPDTGAFPGRIDTFKVTRYDEESNKWVDDDAKNAYAELAEMRSNFNEQLLEIQAQIRDCFKRYLVRDFIGL
ncbi:hypothetical protein ACOSQ3_010040 [Xanthoceras sorbifolium]